MIAGSKLRSSGQVIPFNDLEETIIPGVFRELGCEIFFAAPYNAREKLIEPNFRVFTERLRHLPGYRGHSTKTRPKKLEREIKAGQLLSFEELSREIDSLVNERNARPHSGTGKSPNSFYDNFTPEIPSREMLAFLLMDVHIKRVKDSTITIKGMVYRSESLWELAGESVTCRRDPRDLREAAIIYNDKLFGFARLETAAHYRDPITLESAKTAARIRRKIRNYRTAVIEHEGIIHDPLKFAAELDKEEKLRARDIRAPGSKVVSLHQKERLAREVTKGLKERSDEPVAEAVAAGESILARLNRAAKEARSGEEPRPSIRLVKHLSLDDGEE